MKVQAKPIGTPEEFNVVIQPMILEGDNLRLVPIYTKQDFEKLYETYSKCPEVFRWYPDGPASTREEFVNLYEGFQKDKNRHTFVAYDKNSSPERVIGSVQYLDLYPSHKRNEIGSIWIIPEMRGTYALIEMNYLLFYHAFDILKFHRTQWKTHHENIVSQKAATKLGFTYEATFKHHIIMYDGTTRNSVFYSVVLEDWPLVKENLDTRLLAFKKQ
jgi:N-acetyltransferase